MCFCILKYIFTFVNVILIKLGLAIIAAGVATLVLIDKLKIQEIQGVGVVIIVIGSIFTAIFFCGCCGAVSKNNCLLSTYSVMIFIFAILTIVFTVIYSSNTTYIKNLVVNETAANLNTVQAWEPFLQCCGTTGPDSYDDSAIPITCCPNFDLNGLDPSQIGGNLDNFAQFTCKKSQAYQKGCLDVVGEYVNNVLNIIQNVLICIDISEVIMFAIAISLICENRRSRRKGIVY